MFKKKKRPVLSAVEIQSPIGKAVNYLLLAILTLAVLGPIFIVFNGSFKGNEEYMYSGIFELPKKFTLINYQQVIEKGKMFLAFKNTIILIVISVFLSVMLGSMVAYVLGRFNFKYKKLILLLFLIPTFIPSITTQVATFSIIKGLGLFNTRLAAILIYAGADITQIYIFLQFMDNIPYSLDESATIEGASYFKIYRSIILPQLKPAMATVIILKVIGIYNDMLTPYLYMPKSSLKTVSTALMSFSSDQNSQWNIMGAGIIAVMIPTLVLYLFLQKFIFAGITDGAVKE